MFEEHNVIGIVDGEVRRVWVCFDLADAKACLKDIENDGLAGEFFILSKGGV